MNDPKIKQQVVDSIKNATNILVTVSNDPSVDELSAALGVTLLLNKMEKHATAIFSGATPPAITFLDPQKTFEATTDSLRDFIVALDKEKAEHLRYKVDGDMVKIFITPYKTTITSDDLEFSQGDYNVDLVLALGVEDRESLDKALAGHGRILHDATVVTLSAGEQTSNLGSVDWREPNASSLSEMLVSMTDALKTAKSLLDTPIATAFMTGIVSATERFSNPRTTSRAMTMAAQLMAAGADQQLIATKLEESAEEEAKAGPAEEATSKDGKASLKEGKRTKVPKKQPEEKKPEAGVLSISHEPVGNVDEVAEQTQKQRLEDAADAASAALQDQTTEVVSPDPIEPPVAASASSSDTTVVSEPSFGGTLNATSEQAHQETKQAREQEKSRAILSHSPSIKAEPQFNAPLNSTTEVSDVPPPVDIFAQATSGTQGGAMEPQSAPTAIAPAIAPTSPDLQALPVAPTPEAATAPAMPTLADLDTQNRAPASPQAEDTRAAIDAIFAEQPATGPTLPPVPAGLPLPPPLPDFSAMMPPAPAAPTASSPQDLAPDKLADIFATDPASLTPPPQQAPSDPGQFKIPGQ